MKPHLLRIASPPLETENTLEGTSPSDPTIRSVCVIGLGYIGLPTACILANRGYKVIGVDVRPDVVAKVNAGVLHIEEPDLDEVLQSAVQQGNLKATVAPEAADAFIICVPTPHHADNSPDMRFVEQASESIRPVVRNGNLVILESTSPPESTERIVVPRAIPRGMVVGRDVFAAHCPERVLPGRILYEAVHNDRVVGGVTPECTRRTQAFYQTFVKGKVIGTSATTAEVTKLVENSFRDVNIAFANELSVMCDQFGIDVWEVIELANRHPRVKILNPGPGVGGHCISVDPWFLVHAAPELTRLIRAAREVNDAKPDFVVRKVVEAAGTVEDPVIGCLGLTYKADVDDIRESPSLAIARGLFGINPGQVLVCDPHVPSHAVEFPLHSLDDVLDACNIIVLLTDHKEFRNLPADRLRDKVVIDTRGTWRETLSGRKASAAEPARTLRPAPKAA